MQRIEMRICEHINGFIEAINYTLDLDMDDMEYDFMYDRILSAVEEGLPESKDSDNPS